MRKFINLPNFINFNKISINLNGSVSYVPKDTNFCYIGTIPRSGTWWSFFLFENFYKNIDRNHQLNSSHIYTHYPKLSLAKFHLHSLCPGFESYYKGNLRKKWKEIEIGKDSTFSLDDYIFAKNNSKYFYPQNNKNVKIILLFRNPLDQFLSCDNHFTNHIKFLKEENKLAKFDDFIYDTAIDAYIKQYFSYKIMAENFPDNVKLVSYEDLYRNTDVTFSEILNFFNIDSKNYKNSIQEAVKESSKDKIKKIEKLKGGSLANDQTSKEISHIKNGSIGQWKEHFNKDQIKKISQRFKEFEIELDEFILE